MRKKRNREGGGSETPERRKKSIYGVTEVLGKTAFKKQKTKQHLNHPFTVMQPFVLQHTCTRTRTPNKKNHGERGYENYYFHVVGDRLDEIKLETITENPL